MEAIYIIQSSFTERKMKILMGEHAKESTRSGAGGLAQSVKCEPCKHAGLSLTLGTHTKSPAWKVGVITPLVLSLRG